jgi:hypothetical protein
MFEDAVNQRRTYNTMAKRERTNNNVQKPTQKIKYRATWTPLNPWLRNG